MIRDIALPATPERARRLVRAAKLSSRLNVNPEIASLAQTALISQVREGASLKATQDLVDLDLRALLVPTERQTAMITWLSAAEAKKKQRVFIVTDHPDEWREVLWLEETIILHANKGVTIVDWRAHRSLLESPQREAALVLDRPEIHHGSEALMAEFPACTLLSTPMRKVSLPDDISHWWSNPVWAAFAPQLWKSPVADLFSLNVKEVRRVMADFGWKLVDDEALIDFAALLGLVYIENA